VRIPLDYYQILGIPESNLSELDRAYRDRLDQLPRQGYSDAAIESRKQLISVAYEVLKDPQRRSAYESAQTPQTSMRSQRSQSATSPDPSTLQQSPDLEIAPEHFLGGLLILFEQGKYEEINSICMSYIGNNGRSSNSGSLNQGISSEPSGSARSPSPQNNVDPPGIPKVSRVSSGNVIPLKPDIVLTMVFSLLEMGEQEWKQGEYEVAGSNLDAARKILVQEDLFPQIQGQIERRLGRLRPYRISHLLSLPLDRNEQRLQGIQFLEELLETACQSELDCQERFGLNGERTVQFIHETLPHLTAGEQSNLFGQVAQDSQELGSNSLNVMQLACTYLHVHALIAQGYAYRNPQLIYRAQQILLHRLSGRLNVTIEQAICALLLGQLLEADRMLAAMTESPALVAIRQQSQGSLNPIKGLCWYVETWLKGEVFPCFRDLSANDSALESYFNNPDVQDFVDRLPVEDRDAASWMTSSTKPTDAIVGLGDLLATKDFDDLLGLDLRQRPMISYPESLKSVPSSVNSDPTPTMSGLRASISTAWQSPQAAIESGNLPTAERVLQTTSLPPIPSASTTEQPPTETTETTDISGNVIQLERERRRRRPSLPSIRTIDGQIEALYLEAKSANVVTGYPMTEIKLPTSSQLVPTSKSGSMARREAATTNLARRRRRRLSVNVPRFLLVVTGGLGCAWGAIWLGNTVVNKFQTTANVPPTPKAPAPELAKLPSVDAVKETPPPVQESPVATAPTAKPSVAAGILTADVATQVVQTWLGSKAKSLGKEYQTDQLKDILVEPALSRAIERAKSEKADGIYWQYQHTASVPSVPSLDPKADVATIQAQVQEDAKCYTNGQVKPDRSYSRKLSVKYQLVRQQDRWYVKDMQVVR
jgi:curved DNA-binding protein CbpA